MWRFMTLTFLGLGWAFYSLSDGSDYKPREGSRQALAAYAAANPEPVVDETAAHQEQVSRSAQTLLANLAAEEPSGQRVKVTLPQTTTTEAPNVKIIKAAASAAADTEITEEEPQVTVPSLADYVEADVRRVAGTRVNMREGPSKDYSVVARLVRGTEVQVLSDDGNGWLSLRAVKSGQTGWMAARLVSKRKN